MIAIAIVVGICCFLALAFLDASKLVGKLNQLNLRDFTSGGGAEAGSGAHGHGAAGAGQDVQEDVSVGIDGGGQKGDL